MDWVGLGWGGVGWSTALLSGRWFFSSLRTELRGCFLFFSCVVGIPASGRLLIVKQEFFEGIVL